MTNQNAAERLQRVSEFILDYGMASPEAMEDAMNTIDSAYRRVISWRALRTWKKEFPEMNAEPVMLIMDALVHDGLLEDVSWHNDAACCFSAGSMRLWVEAADPDARESYIDGRFHVTCHDLNDEMVESVIDTDDLSAALTAMRVSMPAAL